MVFFSRKSLKSKRGGEIYPDEIFLDSSNLPDFDTQQFEGRIEKPISKKAIFSLGFFFVCILFIFSFKLFILQIKEGNQYLIRGEDNRLEHSVIFSERGIVYDKKDVELIWNTFDEEEPYAIRNYIEKDGLAHLLGYVSYPLEDSSGNFYQIETIGKDGVENYFNSKIKGENGLKIIEVDALQNIKSESVIKPPKNGENITLTIDSELQSHLYSFIKNLSKDVGFKGGAGVIMNIKNGEILAMSSYPEYNSNILSNSGDKNEIANYIGNKNNPFLNRVTSGLYTPGSIVKPFMALGALTEGVITPDKQILSTGSISLPNPYYPELKSVFKDWKVHGWVDMRRALAVSSDVYFYEIGGGFEGQKGIGILKINEYMKMFGFEQVTGGEVIDEQKGVIPNPEWKKEMFDGEEWTVGNTYHTVIGQYGFQVTPLQVVRAVSALANNGIMLTPVITASSTKNVGLSKTMPIDDKSFEIVKEGMRDAVTEGTAQGLNVGFIKIGAKTGTAELGVSKKYVNSWVVGFFPYDNPKYAFAVIMEEGPKENTIGGLYVMRQLLEWMNINRPEYF
ncbi:hypothetical protein A2442_01205 [Candidatus Campbellbacteria bacterium RIFOXYC2_FULL_35_25]|uniref:Penicillin-binding protein 2 n=1 Tax=Candidatus Campbellbacteria bacterium RIFOXYC2_FULL_35_25 TaxID=1797582 RepID=A0A1F5EH23_9BACT|nr:MAG: hypothetical protein A2442_01205 [Candidatus Campbellbacteria bacterium RIFOXYC2_FULL_35_25]